MKLKYPLDTVGNNPYTIFMNNTYTVKTGYNSFNKVYTAVAYFDNGKQITLDFGNTKEEAETKLVKLLEEKLPGYKRIN